MQSSVGWLSEAGPRSGARLSCVCISFRYRVAMDLGTEEKGVVMERENSFSETVTPFTSQFCKRSLHACRVNTFDYHTAHRLASSLIRGGFLPPLVLPAVEPLAEGGVREWAGRDVYPTACMP